MNFHLSKPLFIIIITLILSMFLTFTHRTSANDLNAFNDSKIGVLVLAHGAGPKWNNAIKEAVANVQGRFKKEIVFGMGEYDSIQQGINNLEKSMVKAIIVIPLFISSHSEMYRNIEYLLGLREEPDVLFWILMGGEETGDESGNGHDGHTDYKMDITTQVKFSVPYSMASAINYDISITKILEERIKELKISDYSKTSIFLLAHGPITEDDNKMWMLHLNIYPSSLSDEFPGANFFALTFRDDAPSFIRNKAIEKIREAIQKEKKTGKNVLVNPYLLAPGGREEELKKILENCGCTFYPKTLLPHKNISLWIEGQILGAKERLQ